MKIKSRFGFEESVDIKVIVFPLPGGPQMMKARFCLIQPPRMYWCLRVSTVWIIREELLICC